jgi:hypothetical protein
MAHRLIAAVLLVAVLAAAPAVRCDCDSELKDHLDMYQGTPCFDILNTTIYGTIKGNCPNPCVAAARGPGRGRRRAAGVLDLGGSWPAVRVH